jgi:phospholipid transport system substrate-binding protein
VGLVAAVALLAGAHGIARAVSPTDELRTFFESAERVLDDPALDGRPLERLEAVRKLLNDIVDFRGAASLTLGPAWRARTQGEQAEFVELFADVLERSYVWRVAARARMDGGVKITYLGESFDGDRATVATAIGGRDGSEIPLDFQVVKRGERWAIRDVVVDGVSVAANFRAQFARILQTSSYPGLVKLLRARSGRATDAATIASEPPTLAPSPAYADRAQLRDALLAFERDAIGAQAAAPVDLATPVGAAAGASRPGVSMHTLAAPRPSGPRSPAPLEPASVERPSRAARVTTEPLGTLPTAPVPVVASPTLGPPALTRVADERRDRFPSPSGASEPSTAAAPATSPVRASVLVPVPVLGALAPVPVTPAPVAESAARPPRSYWVQVGAFRSLEAARRLAAILRGLLTAAEVSLSLPIARAADSFSRVRVGPFTDHDTASAKARELLAKGYRPFVTVAEGRQ